MNTYELLINHFITNHKNKIFLSNIKLSDGNPGIMYFYNKDEELESFKESFGLYLPIYVKNEDILDSMDFSKSIDEKLKIYSKRIWGESTIVPHRATNVNGIYGELFLDIYSRAIKNRKTIISYASRRSFNSNYETKGIDSVLYGFDGDKIELYLGEAKFVTDVYSAKNDLMNDISKGTSPHISTEYLNDYFSFILEKDLSYSGEERRKIKNIFDEFNSRINNIDYPENFTDILIDKNIKVHMICFAIFQGDFDHPDKINKIYNDLILEIDNQFSRIGIVNFDKEIIFIPTKNTSMSIKKEIDSFYD